MEWYHVIEVKYLAPTNSSGARVQLFSPRFQERKVIPFDYSKTGIYEMAANYLKSKGHNIVGGGEGKDIFYLISDTFEYIK